MSELHTELLSVLGRCKDVTNPTVHCQSVHEMMSMRLRIMTLDHSLIIGLLVSSVGGYGSENS